MGYSPFKMAPKSPACKALVGNQHKLPQHLQEKILAAPDSAAKQTANTGKNIDKATVNAARKLLEGMDSMSTYNMSDDQVLKAAKVKDIYYDARSQAKRGVAKKPESFEWGESIKSVAKQTTYGEFMYEKSLKDKEMGKSTKVIDKFTSALEAPFSDKTYAELKKEKRAAQKKKYNTKNKK